MEINNVALHPECEFHNTRTIRPHYVSGDCFGMDVYPCEFNTILGVFSSVGTLNPKISNMSMSSSIPFVEKHAGHEVLEIMEESMQLLGLGCLADHFRQKIKASQPPPTSGLWQNKLAVSAWTMTLSPLLIDSAATGCS